MGTPRGIRNNNFGNIRKSKDKWIGLKEVQSDPSFFQFKEPKYGYRALLKILINYRKKYGLKTISEMINKYAPKKENNTTGYITRVCKEMQVPPTYVPDVEDKATMCAMAAAISLVENGVPANMVDIEKGWNLL